jgi:hypothetical protein
LLYTLEEFGERLRSLGGELKPVAEFACGSLGESGLYFRPGESIPRSIGDFIQALIDLNSKVQLRGNNTGGLCGAAQSARYDPADRFLSKAAA